MKGAKFSDQTLLYSPLYLLNRNMIFLKKYFNWLSISVHMHVCPVVHKPGAGGQISWSCSITVSCKPCDGSDGNLFHMFCNGD